jgi:hypothetical protein
MLYVENKTDDIKKSISECLMKAAEQRKQKTMPSKPEPVKPKVQEVTTPEPSNKGMKIEEASSDSDDAEELKKLKKKAKSKTKQIDE